MKLKYILLIILLVLASLFAGSVYFADKLVTNLINDLKKEQLDLSFVNLEFSVIDRELSLDSLAFVDSTKGINIHIKKLSVENISISSLLLNDQLSIENLTIDQPTIHYVQKQLPSDSSTSKQKKPKKIQTVFIDNVNINKGDVTYADNDGENKLWGISVQLKNLQQHLDSAVKIKRLFNEVTYCEVDSSALSLIKQHNTTTKKLYLKNGTIAISDLAIKTKKLSSKTDYKFNLLSVKQVSANFNPIKDINTLKLLTVNKLEVEDLNYSCLKDKRHSESKKVKPMPMDLIKSIPFPIMIDSIELTGKSISYKEKTNNSSTPGKVNFTDVKASITNFTNDSASIATNKIMTAKLSARLMNKEYLNVNVYQDLESPVGNHTVKGSLKNFNLLDLNQAFKPLASVEFENGKLNSLDFEFNASNSSSSGSASFKYNDLKIVFLSDKKIFKPSILSRLETTLANALIIRKSNPLRGNFQEGTIQYTRDPNMSFLNYWWKSVFSGMKSSMIRFSD